MFRNSPSEWSLFDGAKEHIEEWPDDDCSDPERYEVYDKESEGSFGSENVLFFSFCHLILSLWLYYSMCFVI